VEEFGSGGAPDAEILLGDKFRRAGGRLGANKLEVYKELPPRTVEGGGDVVPFAVDEVDQCVTVGVYVQVVAPVIRSHRMVSVHPESVGAMQDAVLAPAHNASVRIARGGGSYPGLDGIRRASER
jgi:hypothetical protein